MKEWLLQVVAVTYLLMEQCPPTAAFPEPAAMTGGSSLRSTVGDACQSQAIKPSKATQNSHFSDG